ncbi:MAG: hypothetical protein QOG83_1988, partial [Alphaproteobacteria bacterium]|nr:hypothetical protein [Alphaproteobacteria bacterium]
MAALEFDSRRLNHVWPAFIAFEHDLSENRFPLFRIML